MLCWLLEILRNDMRVHRTHKLDLSLPFSTRAIPPMLKLDKLTRWRDSPQIHALLDATAAILFLSFQGHCKVWRTQHLAPLAEVNCAGPSNCFITKKTTIYAVKSSGNGFRANTLVGECHVWKRHVLPCLVVSRCLPLEVATQASFPVDCDFGETAGLDGVWCCCPQNITMPPCINMTVDAPKDTSPFEWAVLFASLVRARLSSKK